MTRSRSARIFAASPAAAIRGGMFVDTDGVGIDILDPKKDRETLGLYLIQFAEWDNPVGARTKYATPRPKKPVLSHETANYITFSRPNGASVPTRRQAVLAHGGQGQAGEVGIARRGSALGREIRAALLAVAQAQPGRDPQESVPVRLSLVALSGLLDKLQRNRRPLLPPQVDHGGRVLRVNNDVALAGRPGSDLSRQEPLGPETLRVKFFPRAACRRVCLGGLGPGTIPRQAAGDIEPGAQGDVIETAKIGLELPEATLPTRLKITAALTAGGRTIRNDWSAWLYPATVKPAASAVPVFADEAAIAHCRGWDVKPIPPEGPLVQVVYVTGWLDKRTIDARRTAPAWCFCTAPCRFRRRGP